jgi:glucose/arabinose dehydrogenase
MPGKGERVTNRFRRGLGLLAALAAGACAQSDSGMDPTPAPSPTPSAAECQPVSGTPALTTQRVAQGLDRPLDLQTPPGDRARVFVVEQRGRIRVLRGSSVVAAPFLDVTDRVGSGGGEQGLLGLAFHPRYAENGRFFVNYTDRSGDTRISEFRAPSPASDSADASSERLVLGVDQPFSNHNGGGLAFGPDGFLYIGLGDGGSGGDPLENGQDLETPLGKMLRIDVDRGTPFAIPPDNPFVGTPGAFPAIWAYGLRNPWRFAFSRASGDLLIGDVGQNQHEEIDLGVASRRGGENYGWNTTEGNHCFDPPSGCNTAGITPPILEYDHGQGCSVTGGVVYDGCRMPGYHGTYFYGDYCTAFIRSFRVEAGRATELRDWTASLRGGIRNISAFGVDADGEIHILDHEGEVYRVVPQG